MTGRARRQQRRRARTRTPRMWLEVAKRSAAATESMAARGDMMVNRMNASGPLYKRGWTNACGRATAAALMNLSPYVIVEQVIEVTLPGKVRSVSTTVKVRA